VKIEEEASKLIAKGSYRQKQEENFAMMKVIVN